MLRKESGRVAILLCVGARIPRCRRVATRDAKRDRAAACNRCIVPWPPSRRNCERTLMGCHGWLPHRHVCSYVEHDTAGGKGQKNDAFSIGRRLGASRSKMNPVCNASYAARLKKVDSEEASMTDPDDCLDRPHRCTGWALHGQGRLSLDRQLRYQLTNTPHQGESANSPAADQRAGAFYAFSIAGVQNRHPVPKNFTVPRRH